MLIISTANIRAIMLPPHPDVQRNGAGESTLVE